MRRECEIPYFLTEQTRDWPNFWLRLKLNNQTTKSTDASSAGASYFPAHLVNQPTVQITRTIAKKTRHLLPGSLSKTEYEERYQRQVPDEEINSLDDNKYENEGRLMSPVTSADAGTWVDGCVQPPDPITAMTNTVYFEPAGLMFVRLGFEVAAEHSFVLQDIMSSPKNIIWLDDRRVEKLVTVAS